MQDSSFHSKPEDDINPYDAPGIERLQHSSIYQWPLPSFAIRFDAMVSCRNWVLSMVADVAGKPIGFCFEKRSSRCFARLPVYSKSWKRNPAQERMSLHSTRTAKRVRAITRNSE